MCGCGKEWVVGVGDSTAVDHCDPVERRMSNVAVTVFVAMSVLG